MSQFPASSAAYAVEIAVKPRYLPAQSLPIKEVYTFAYTITISNVGAVPAQLISRYWLIVDEDGGREEVRGLGVVGHQPLLKPGEAFEYTSGSRLRTPTGTMQGHYFFVADDGERFEAEIPVFALDATGVHV
jgi:ApaG protein